MPNYEELYNNARNRYNQAVDNKNTIIRRTNELSGQKTTLANQLQQYQNALATIQNKEALVRDVIKKAENIKDNEFKTMKSDLCKAGGEYKKVFSSDLGVADLESIYETDISSTSNNLDSIIKEMNTILTGLVNEETTAKKNVSDCSNELDSVTRQLNNVGSESAAQRQIDICYAEMKTYETKWLNGE